MKGQLSLTGFLWQYFRRYLAWSLLAVGAILTYASASLVLVALFEPIFREVLLTDPSAVAGSGVSGAAAGLLGGEEAAPAATPGPPASASPSPPPPALSTSKANVRRLIAAGYAALKTRFGIDASNVVYFAPALFVLFFLLRSLADFVSGFAFQRIGLGSTTAIRNDLYRRILEQSSRFYSEHPSGELVSRVVNDIALIQNAISSRLLDLFQQGVQLLFFIALLVSISPPIAFVCLVAAPLLVFPIVRFGKGMRRTSRRSQERMAELASLLSEGVRGHRVVKAFGMETFELDRFRAATARHLKVTLHGELLSNLSSPVVESVAVVGAGALLVFAGQQIRHGGLDPALLITILANLFAMYDPVRKLNKVNLILQQSLAATQRVRDLMAVPVDIVDRPGAVELSGFADAITYRQVHFSYDREPVLRGLGLVVRKGETVALVGRNGSGKSTVVSLLPRFYDPDTGSVEIDGRDVRDLRLASLRRHIAVVTQETILFADTVRANIAYGRADVPLERVRDAARLAYCDDFVQALPQGYDTVLGEGGSGLSGGQKQRLAIARAILRDAPILILDEATSALDPESESLVQKALANLMQGRTTLVIAHRLSTVRSADRIVVLEAGRVVETGSHDALMERGNGVYKYLYDLQFDA
jgi:subfamily B ATP-binding cassette protein MsbA